VNPHYRAVAERAGHRCEYCHAPEAIFNFPLEVEHVIPPNLGGADDESNWALACRSCNLFKSDHTESQDPETGITASFFHPRKHEWNEHFRIDLETGAIVGTTPIGRATSDCLRMNSDSQLAARLQWMRIGLFP
jgi:hypothetical protein